MHKLNQMKLKPSSQETDLAYSTAAEVHARHLMQRIID